MRPERPPRADAPEGGALRERILDRVRRSKARQAGIVTIRRGAADWQAPAPGVRWRSLLDARADASRRPGEAVRILHIELAAGVRWQADLMPPGHVGEWLVQRGDVTLDGQALMALDHACVGAAAGPVWLQTTDGCLLHVTDSGPDGPPPQLSRAANAQWQPYLPGIQRRLLWRHQGQIGFLARASAGAGLPPHHHDHDEQCLMLAGELYASDILLRAGDFQLVPAGVDHGDVEAATELLAYLRGDGAPRVVV